MEPQLHLPLFIVASTALGTINHTLLTIEAARFAQLSIAGIILSGHPDPGLANLLTKLTGVPIIAEIPWIEVQSHEEVKQHANTLFKKEIFYAKNIAYET